MPEAWTLTVLNHTRQTVLATRVEIADTFSTRLRGLLGRRRLARGEGLLIHPSSAVHTMGMLFSIDVLFLDADHRVLGLCPALSPFRISPFFRRAECVLELPAHTAAAARTEVGDLLGLEINQVRRVAA